MLEFKTALEGVALVNLGQVFRGLQRGVEFLRNQEGIAAQLLKIADGNRRQPSVERNLRNTWDSVFRRNVAGVVAEGLQAAGSDPAQSDSSLVNERR